MSTQLHIQPPALPLWLRHGAWFAIVATGAFLIPFVGVSILGRVYFVLTGALLGAYVRAEHTLHPRMAVEPGALRGGRRCAGMERPR